MAWDQRVPFMGEQQQTYVSGSPRWIDNHKFLAELSIIDHHKGRSAAYISARVDWIDDTSPIKVGSTLYLTLASLTKMVSCDDECASIIQRNGQRPGFMGKYTFVKRGQNYYCEVVDA